MKYVIVFLLGVACGALGYNYILTHGDEDLPSTIDV